MDEQMAYGRGVSAGDAIAPGCKPIEVRVAELRQLFNAIDPSPFHDRDLDPAADEFIVEWAKEMPRSAALALVVHLDRPAGPPGEVEALRASVQQNYRRSATSARRRLRALFHRGRISLVIGLAFLGVSIAIADVLADFVGSTFLRETVIIGGWVAMWRPLEVFLYDWWPIRTEQRLYDRLATMPVRIHYGTKGDAEAWRRDWPAIPASPRTQGPDEETRHRLSSVDP